MRRSLLALALLALPGIAYAHPAVDRATALVLDGATFHINFGAGIAALK